ncbi:MAG: hypothetical protein Q8P41_22375 [Pseudomonadota bacterium]|nr:hypothetical protein [Pseudomonadota bacterium]
MFATRPSLRRPLRIALSTALCAILGSCGTEGTKDDTGEDDTGETTGASCSDDACPYDQFCYNDACTPVDGRSFNISFPYGVEIHSPATYTVKVRVSTAEDSCETEEQEDPVDAFRTSCDWLVDLDEPYLEVKVLESGGSTWAGALTEEYMGTDALLGLIRNGGDVVSGTTEFYGHYMEVEFVVAPEF